MTQSIVVTDMHVLRSEMVWLKVGYVILCSLTINTLFDLFLKIIALAIVTFMIVQFRRVDFVSVYARAVCH